MPARRRREETMTETAETEETASNGARRGRKALTEEEKKAPHGYDENGQPKAPYGHLGDGRPRQYPLVETDIPELEVEELGAFAPPSADMLALTKPVQARSEKQGHFDEIVAKLHAKWVAVGEPRTWQDLLEKGTVGGFWVAPKGVDGLKRLIDRAGRFHEYSVRYGSLVPRQPGMPADGKVYLPFAVRDVVKRKENESEDADG
jgi:hypothetical protein